jgi:hypothetical protein
LTADQLERLRSNAYRELWNFQHHSIVLLLPLSVASFAVWQRFFPPAKGSARVVNQLPASVATFSTTSSPTSTSTFPTPLPLPPFSSRELQVELFFIYYLLSFVAHHGRRYPCRLDACR